MNPKIGGTDTYDTHQNVDIPRSQLAEHMTFNHGVPCSIHGWLSFVLL